MVRGCKGAYRVDSFHHDDPPPLVELQKKLWEPLLEWARTTYGVEIQVFDSILFHSQPEQTRKILGDVVGQMDPWEMAGMFHTQLYELILNISSSNGACYLRDKILPGCTCPCEAASYGRAGCSGRTSRGIKPDRKMGRGGRQ